MDSNADGHIVGGDALNNHELSRLIEGIYDCAVDPALWPSTLSQIASALASPAATLNVLDLLTSRERTLVYSGISDRYQALYREQYHRCNIFAHGMMLQPLGEPATSDELVDEADLLASRIYREWAAPQDFRHVMLTTLIRTGARLAFIGVTRTHGQPRYTSRDKELMVLLAPHVRRAVTIADLIDHKSFEHEVLAEVLDALSTAVLLVEGAGRLVHANAAGEALLSRGDVLALRLDLVEPWDASALREAWPLSSGRARASGTRTLTLTRRGGGQVSVSLLPLDAGRRRVLAKGEARTALFIQNAEVAPNAVEALGTTYKLTGAELRVLLGLTEGRTAADIATHYGIALTTVRTHLRSLFAKTGLSRQKDLIGLLFTAPPLRSSSVP